jgi:ribulose-5-phosphate 4-epimerase/fuculose-1-phosphate aldolase
LAGFVHSHSPTVIPLSITQTELRPVFHRASFLSCGVPAFEIREVAGTKNNMLVNDAKRAEALAQALGEKNVALMWGHGNVVVASRLRLAVSRAIETEVNAKLQLQALMIGGPINYLSAGEAETSKPISPEPNHRTREVLIAFGRGSNGYPERGGTDRPRRSREGSRWLSARHAAEVCMR